jgi:hypothetical protein
MTPKQEEELLAAIQRIPQYLQGIGEALNEIFEELKKIRVNQETFGKS